MRFAPRAVLPFLSCLLLASCSDATNPSTTANNADTGATAAPVIREEAVTITDGATTLSSFVYSDSASAGRRPAIVVVPEWWGLTDYAKMRAKELAKLGYTAVALDMYGNGKIAADPKEAMALAGPFYGNPALFASRINSALSYLRTRPEVDSTRLGAMGYCFGGSAALNAARMGAPVKGVVSFHGDFPDAAWPKGAFNGQVLICHGAADSFVPMNKYELFRRRLDSAGVVHTDKVYPDATHAFSNPEATATGEKFQMPIRYNGAADTASWNDMKAFWSSVLK
ncbi:MAG: dienelactone hydrolase family protein [Chitinophagaceae bacterium]|nr:MAG: dienelactone hydrolase family protein [Chitinophagaceae bacterium]